ncbi:hypothetical protein PENSPDRAFT_749084 [Peniophora sp. CONT]|nr:hypothetical protein PENSPDRAFT_749084 [Peniophora sp. CONT]
MPALNLVACIGTNKVNYRIASTTRAQRLTNALVDHLGLLDPGKLRIIGAENRLKDNLTLEEQGVEDGDELCVLFEQAGGFIADGIYIQSPTDIPQLSMEMIMTPGIMAKYTSLPGVDGLENVRGAIEWNGSVKGVKRDFSGYNSSSLQERETGHEAHGLSWLTSLDPETAEGSLAATELVLDDERAAVIEYKDVANYISSALSSLSLDESDIKRFFYAYYQRMITSGRYVAIRFVEQAVYEQVAPLAISPSPSVVTRVVMLFQGLNETEVAAWGRARERAQLGPRYWKDVIGFDERATDASLYRALEWRAMEIPAANTVA